MISNVIDLSHPSFIQMYYYYYYKNQFCKDKLLLFILLKEKKRKGKFPNKKREISAHFDSPTKKFPHSPFRLCQQKQNLSLKKLFETLKPRTPPFSLTSFHHIFNGGIRSNPTHSTKSRPPFSLPSLGIPPRTPIIQRQPHPQSQDRSSQQHKHG